MAAVLGQATGDLLCDVLSHVNRFSLSTRPDENPIPALDGAKASLRRIGYLGSCVASREQREGFAA
jgi:hypothetical protein